MDTQLPPPPDLLVTLAAVQEVLQTLEPLLPTLISLAPSLTALARLAPTLETLTPALMQLVDAPRLPSAVPGAPRTKAVPSTLRPHVTPISSPHVTLPRVVPSTDAEGFSTVSRKKRPRSVQAPIPANSLSYSDILCHYPPARHAELTSALKVFKNFGVGPASTPSSSTESSQSIRRLYLSGLQRSSLGDIKKGWKAFDISLDGLVNLSWVDNTCLEVVILADREQYLLEQLSRLRVRAITPDILGQPGSERRKALLRRVDAIIRTSSSDRARRFFSSWRDEILRPSAYAPIVSPTPSPPTASTTPPPPPISVSADALLKQELLGRTKPVLPVPPVAILEELAKQRPLTVLLEASHDSGWAALVNQTATLLLPEVFEASIGSPGHENLRYSALFSMVLPFAPNPRQGQVVTLGLLPDTPDDLLMSFLTSPSLLQEAAQLWLEMPASSDDEMDSASDSEDTFAHSPPTQDL